MRPPLRMLRRFALPLAGWTAALAGTALALSLATNAAGPQASPPSVITVPAPPAPGTPSVLTPPPGLQAQSPPANSADLAASEAVLSNDPTFQRLLGKIGYTVVSSTPWEDNAGSSQLGTELTLKLNSPLNGVFRLPGVSFDSPSNPRDYTPRMIPARVTGASTLTVLVDLGSHTVVSVLPPDSTLSPVAGTPAAPPGWTGN